MASTDFYSDRIVYLHTLPSSVEVNLAQGRGFRLTAVDSAKFNAIKRFIESLAVGKFVTLHLIDGRIDAVLNLSDNKLLELSPDYGIGAVLLEKTFKKVSAIYNGFAIKDETFVLLVNGAEKGQYNFKNVQRMKRLFSDFNLGDRLSLLQAPNGKITNIVNQTRVCECSCF